MKYLLSLANRKIFLVLSLTLILMKLKTLKTARKNKIAVYRVYLLNLYKLQLETKHKTKLKSKAQAQYSTLNYRI